MKKIRENKSNKYSLRTNTNKNSKKKNNSLYYSIITIIITPFICQIIYGVIFNVSKIVSYKNKIVQITKMRDDAKIRNEQLQDSIKNFSNITGLEAIARNNLKMSSEDEVLIIINSKQNEENTKEIQHNWFGKKND